MSTMKVVRSDRGGDTEVYELDYASGILVTTPVVAGITSQSTQAQIDAIARVTVGPFNSPVVMISNPSAPVSVRGDGQPAGVWDGGSIFVNIFEKIYVPVDPGQTLSVAHWGGGGRLSVIPTKAT